MLSKDAILDLMATVFNTGKNEVAGALQVLNLQLTSQIFVVTKHYSNIRQLNIMYL